MPDKTVEANESTENSTNLEDALLCPRCKAKTLVRLRSRPFGFSVDRCSSCSKRIWGPLSAGARVFYWVLVLIASIGAVILLGSGWILIPSIPVLLAAVLLLIDAALKKSIGSAIALSSITVGLIFSALLGAAIAVGASNGYTTTVVDQRGATYQVFESMSLSSGDPICGGGEDYNTCLNLHIAMYNSVCLDPEPTLFFDGGTVLSESALATCNDLDKFIEDVRKRAASCGYGCTTRVDKDGRWGWGYLTPYPQMREVAVPRITHIETCWFELGPARVGECQETST